MTSFGRYQLEDRIAQGGMGEVFRATDVGYEGVGRTVAVKRIAPAYARDPEFLSTFKNEARLSFLLGHANVVRLLEVGESAGSLFLVFEWVHGADLAAILAQVRRDSGEPMPIRLALTIAADMARGLDYAHRLVGPDGKALGLVHRDVSPSNVLLSVEGEVKVTDFGIARSHLRQSMSLPGQLKGKLFYMAPEQAHNATLDRRADVFALGAVLYEMLCGTNPFLARGNEGDLLDRVLRGDYPPPTDFEKNLDPELVAIVLMAMAPDREKRFDSCRQMRDALIDYAVGKSYALSQDELGDFVRALCERSGPRLQSTSPPTIVGRKSRPPVVRTGTTPKSHPTSIPVSTASLLLPRSARFDGEQGQPTPPEIPLVSQDLLTEESTVSTARLGKPPRDEAEVPPPDVSPVEPSADKTSTDKLSRRALVGAVLTLLGIVVVGALGAKLLRAGAETPPPEAPFPAPPEAPTPPPFEAPTSRLPPRPNPSLKVGLLSVESDQAAVVYIDGELAGPAPLVDFAVAPGSHRVKLRTTGRGLFVVPKESTVSLRAGERRHLKIPIRGWKHDAP